MLTGEVVMFILGLIIFITFVIILGRACEFFGDKGKMGERKVDNSLCSTLEPNTYCVFSNVIIPDNIGGTTQIDHIVSSPYGIFVIETKNLTGWIFGSTNSKMWMQQIFSEKHQFYSPIRQNYKHIACLVQLTGLPKKYFYPVIVFTGDASVKTICELPGYVTTGRREMLQYIRSHTQRIIDDNTLKIFHDVIRTRRCENSEENQKIHIEHVRSIMSGQRAREIPLCPRCGREMVKRQARHGKYAGQSFWGCPNYPTCRGIVNER